MKTSENKWLMTCTVLVSSRIWLSESIKCLFIINRFCLTGICILHYQPQLNTIFQKTFISMKEGLFLIFFIYRCVASYIYAGHPETQLRRCLHHHFIISIPNIPNNLIGSRTNCLSFWTAATKFYGLYEYAIKCLEYLLGDSPISRLIRLYLLWFVM